MHRSASMQRANHVTDGEEDFGRHGFASDEFLPQRAALEKVDGQQGGTIRQACQGARPGNGQTGAPEAIESAPFALGRTQP